VDETKRCCTCHQIRPMSDFNIRSAAADGRQSRCRECARAWYRAHRDEHQVNTRRRTAAVRAEYKRRIGEHLRRHPCVDCGESDIRVLDFDHDVRVPKVAAVASLVAAAGSWSAIEAEIAKCAVRCANCHRRITSTRAEDWRHGLSLTLREATQSAAHRRLQSLLA
jgi:hypothetical protein